LDREREYDAWIEADRVDSREEGGAYCSGGRAGYGSIIRTSWREEVPNPVHQHCISNVLDLPLKVTSTDGLKSLTLISSSPSSSTAREVDPRFEISGLTSSSRSTNSGETLRSATETERVLDLDLALGTRFLLLGVVDGSMVGGGVGALNENSFSYYQ
jgi:hypothetical protein